MAAHEYLEIDCDTRKVTIPSAEKVFGVYLDANAERKYFSCERYVGDDVDLSGCSIAINFKSVSGNTYTYTCDDVALSDDEETVTFSWLLTDEVFDVNKNGTVYFSVQAINSAGTTVFNTRLAEGKVYESIGETEYTADELIGTLTTATFTIDEDGDLIMTVEEGDTEVSAEVTEDGELEVTA